MKTCTYLLFGLIAWLAHSIGAAAQNITFYDTMSGANFVQWWQTQAVPACRSEAKGDIRYASAGSPEILQRIKAAGASGGDIDLLFLAPDKIAAFHTEGVLEDLSQFSAQIPNLAKTEGPDNQTAAGMDLKGSGAPFFRYTYALIYNSDVVKNPPRTWKELYERRDEWKGRISYVDPRSTVSGAGRFFTAMFLRAFGANGSTVDASWDPAWERLKEFEAANAKKHAEFGRRARGAACHRRDRDRFSRSRLCAIFAKARHPTAVDPHRADGRWRTCGRRLSGHRQKYPRRAQTGRGALHQLRALGRYPGRHGARYVPVPGNGNLGQVAR